MCVCVLAVMLINSLFFLVIPFDVSCKVASELTSCLKNKGVFLLP